MDIYRFINSKDIRFHLQSLRYDFTLPEAAFLVWQCTDATLEEKHEAWCELIRTMPDCGMQKAPQYVCYQKHARPSARLYEI